MKGITLAALAGIVLLSGCAAPADPNGQQTVADRSDAPLGSYIKRKPGSRNDTVKLDKQTIENERVMNNGAIDLPHRQ